MYEGSECKDIEEKLAQDRQVKCSDCRHIGGDVI
jgi:hypothetical protein